VFHSSSINTVFLYKLLQSIRKCSAIFCPNYTVPIRNAEAEANLGATNFIWSWKRKQKYSSASTSLVSISSCYNLIPFLVTRVSTRCPIISTIFARCPTL